MPSKKLQTTLLDFFPSFLTIIDLNGIWNLVKPSGRPPAAIVLTRAYQFGNHSFASQSSLNRGVVTLAIKSSSLSIGIYTIICITCLQ